MMSPDQVFELFDRRPQAFRRIPLATYRLQLDRTFTFAAAREIVPYLDALGVTDCYLSPFLQASSAESHGYDVSDHGRFDASLGTEAEYRAFTDELRARAMGQLIDVVPNHMGIAGSRNAWWADVLENGPASPYASYFDIDWDPAEPGLENRVLLPILGDQYGRVLENGELTLEFRDGAFVVRYWDAVLPVSPRSSALVLRLRLDELAKTLGEGSADVLELTGIVTALTRLPPRTETDPERLAERNRERQVIKRRLATLAAESPDVRAFVEENVRILNGSKGDSASFDRLDELLGGQAYRLAFWQVAADEINLYQTLLGAWPAGSMSDTEYADFTERVRRFMFKALREAKVNVSWINPRPEYDDAVRQFIDAILDRSAPNPFLDDFLPLQRTVARWGMFNTLAQTLLKLTAPGVPDLYQGSELWDLSLVDPDNRRPVDFALRRRLLETLDATIRATRDLAALARALVDAGEDGRVKLYLIRQTLAFRRARAALFRDGEYKPVDFAGPLAEHVCAFARMLGSEAALTLVPRLLARRGVEGPPLGRDWWGSDTGALVPGGAGARFRNVFTGERLEPHDGALALGDVFASFPVALLARET